MPEKSKIHIISDYRERPSGIPDMLDQCSFQHQVATLSAGDFLINGHILVERKTAEDFIQSLIQKRLFEQCAKLKHSIYFPLIIIEGNPYKTRHSINREAIRGALISISACWQIPVLFTKDHQDTFEMLLTVASQTTPKDTPLTKKGYKPRRTGTNKMFFLQGIPSVGSKIALRLVSHFGSLIDTLNATKEQLSEIKGIGINKAKKIREFLDTNNSQ